MSYKKELKAAYRTKLLRQNEIMAASNGRNMTTREREDFSDLKRELDSIDTKLSKLGVKDTRGTIARAGDVGEKRTYKHNDRVTGRTAEVLDSKMSMRKWVDRAAERGATVESRSGQPSRIMGSSFDENAYWGQRLGLSKPGAETRALAEDTSGSGLAITPQSWTARFIDYAYPQTLLGRLGASMVPMQTELVNVPQLTAPVQPQWVSEAGATVLDANPAFSTLQLAAKGMFYDITLYSMELA